MGGSRQPFQRADQAVAHARCICTGISLRPRQQRCGCSGIRQGASEDRQDLHCPAGHCHRKSADAADAHRNLNLKQLPRSCP